MAIIFKGPTSGLESDAKLANPYANAGRYATEILGMANNIQDRFDKQGVKNELEAREFNTARLASDIMSGKFVDFATIDPGTVNGKELTDLMMKKTAADANSAYKTQMLQKQTDLMNNTATHQAAVLKQGEDRAIRDANAIAAAAEIDKIRLSKPTQVEVDLAQEATNTKVVEASNVAMEGITTQEELEAKRAELRAKGDLVSLAVEKNLATHIMNDRNTKYGPKKQEINLLLRDIAAGGTAGEDARRIAKEKYPYLGMSLAEKKRYVGDDNKIKPTMLKEVTEKFGTDYSTNSTLSDAMLAIAYNKANNKSTFWDNDTIFKSGSALSKKWNNNSPEVIREYQTKFVEESLDRDINAAKTKKELAKAKKEKRIFLDKIRIKEVDELLKLRQSQLIPTELF